MSKQINTANSKRGKALKYERLSMINRPRIRTTQLEMYDTNWQIANSQLHAYNAYEMNVINQ